MTDSLHNAPIVLDNGSGTIRAGFAGDDVPKCHFPSFVGRPKHLRVLAGALEGEVFIGQKAATELRGLLKIRYPLEHGIVTDWDDMEKIWGYVYDEGLKTLSEEVRIFRPWPPNVLTMLTYLRLDSIPSSSPSHRSTPDPTATRPPRFSLRPSTYPLSTHRSRPYYPCTPAVGQRVWCWTPEMVCRMPCPCTKGSRCPTAFGG
jgi:hypothetical protein